MKRRAFLASLAALVEAAANWPALHKVTPPLPGHLQLHPGPPPRGAVDDRILSDLTRELGHFGDLPGLPGGAKEVVAWGKALERTVLLAARPPQLGENWLWWSTGLVEADGACSVGTCGGPGNPLPLPPLQASGSHNLRVGGQYWGQVAGVVSKRAARVRVLFDIGIPPLNLVPVEVGDRFPVNFYAGFYQQPRKDERPCTWQVVRVVAFDKRDRKVAERQIGGTHPER
jgi:hypothetical protein